MANDEGLLIGPYSETAIFLAREIINRYTDASIVVVACDGGKQYLDTVFDDDWMTKRGYRLR